MQEINDTTFEAEVLNEKTNVLVDFWAEWCGPCRQLGPVLEEVSKELEGKVKIVKMNIDHAPETPTKYGIRGIPTMILFKDGQQVSTKVGALPKTQILQWLNSEIK
ncbi:MAG: thioredoxin [Alphaproteobacteria bacterium]